MWDFCNDLCIRILSWLVGLFGFGLLPPGCRAIPAGHFNFDPAIAVWFGGKDGVVSSEYVIVAVCIIAAVLAAFGTNTSTGMANGIVQLSAVP